MIYPLAFRAEGVLLLPASVCPSVLPELYLVRTITPSHIWARITKFAPSMHPGILSAGNENKGHWPWPSRSFWPFWLRILGNFTCLRNKLLQIWAGITKSAPNMHHGILLSGIENRGQWPWPSRSFWPFCLRILGNFTCLRNNLKWILFQLESPNCTKYASWASLDWYWIQGSLTLTFKVISNQDSKKRRSTSLLYTDLARPRGITHPNVLLSLVRFCRIHLGSISQWVTKLLLCIIDLKIILLKLLTHPVGPMS